MGAPTVCSILIVNDHIGALQSSNSSNATYLFQANPNDQYDLGDRSLQCGRRADAFKFWMMWKRFGTNGLAKKVDTAFKNANLLKELIKKHSNFELIDDEVHANCCYRYIPPAFVLKKGEVRTREYDLLLGNVQTIIFQRMTETGKILIQKQPLIEHKKPSFFRSVMIQDRVRDEDVRNILIVIEEIGVGISREDAMKIPSEEHFFN